MKRKTIRPVILIVALLLACSPLIGCGGSDENNASNNGQADAGTEDIGDEDTGMADTSTEDTGTEDAGNDTGTEDTGPDPCEADERVEAGTCVACAPGTTNEAGDDPSGDDTQCEAVLCEADQRVESNACVDCGDGLVSEAGADASGPDTQCYTDDNCYAVLGVDCDAYHEAYIKADTSLLNSKDFFGNAVALSDDGQTLVVGAFWDEPVTEVPNWKSGLVYVFEREGTMWSQAAVLEAADGGGQGHFFGTSVAISGETVVVGANGANSAAGAAYVFDRDAQGDWSQTSMLEASNAGDGDEFGKDVDIDGDTIVVGAFKEDSKTRVIDGAGDNDEAPDAGAAYVFERDAQGTWAETTYMKAANAGQGDAYGISVSIDGDTIAVGSRFDDSDSTGVDADASNNNLNNAGSVFVYARDGQSWAQQAYIKASNAGNSDGFGYQVELAGDTLAVSAPGEQSGDSGVDADQSLDDMRTGAVYVFTRAGTAWSQQVYIKAPNNVTSYNPVFGQSLALSATGDTLAVGAVLERSAASGLDGNMTDFQQSHTDSGAVFTFTRDAGSWSEDLYIKAPNSYGLQRFGQSVAFSDDAGRLVVGAHFESGGTGGVNADMSDTSRFQAGAVYMHRLAP